MSEYKLTSVNFVKLKGLEDICFNFTKPLTAIMGVNGSGKTTVIHALACVYQPTDHGHGGKYTFPNFFIPNTDALWQGSKFIVYNEVIEKKGENKTSSVAREYSKKSDRWSPRYNKKPKRNVYYIGIDSCLPEIEKNNSPHRINYSSTSKSDKMSQDIVSYAGAILNKSYQELLENTYQKKKFSGVKLKNGLKYSSLSMGTGEQRIIKILEVVLKAESNSLILIDEIDLLLHVNALKNLIKYLSEIAKDKKLQIVFTTHSLEMAKLSKYVGIQYINHYSTRDGKKKALVFDSINSDLEYELTGTKQHPIALYCEDDVAERILKVVIQSLNMSSKCKVIKYGAMSNAFSLATALVINTDLTPNSLIVLDGDEYRNREDKIKQLNKRLTGTEPNFEDKRKAALDLIREFNLPEGKSPERFIYDLLVQYGDQDSELVRVAKNINSVVDTHDLLNKIYDKLNEQKEIILQNILTIISKTPEWEDFINPIKTWLKAKENI